MATGRAILPGTLIANRYRVQRPLGVGGGGEAYVVFDTHEGETVVLKLLSRPHPSGTWVEAHVLRHLTDPHILPIRNADVASGRPYVVTELATHGTLADRLAACGTPGLHIDDGQGSCVVVTVSPKGDPTSAECQSTTRFGHNTIQSAGLDHLTSPQTFPIVGGTGRFRDAGGQIIAGGGPGEADIYEIDF